MIVFFTSLAGIGYVAPDEIETTVAFLPGTPVFDLAGRQALERRMEEQRELEQTWAKKKRPKDVGLIFLCCIFLQSGLTNRGHGCKGLEMIKRSEETNPPLQVLVRALPQMRSSQKWLVRMSTRNSEMAILYRDYLFIF